MELEVLISNDWNTYRPKFIIVEILDCDLSNVCKKETNNFLVSIKYKLIARLINSFIYKDETYSK